MNDPELLFLDEPTLGLDPDVSQRLRRRVAELRRERGMTIVLTTHYMREAEELCDEIAFIKRGQILARGTADELKRRIAIGDVIAFRLDPPGPGALAGVPGVLRCGRAMAGGVRGGRSREAAAGDAAAPPRRWGGGARPARCASPTWRKYSLNWRAEWPAGARSGARSGRPAPDELAR